ncbi:MAG: GerMN domain-containing protein [Clostridia bacterium]|nr:GerMN domain-containing protein [Clostridia bacterium]
MGKQRWWLVALVVLVLAAGFSYFALPWRPWRTRRQLPPGPSNGTEVTLYFVNREYITTGNEELPKLLPFTRRIMVQGDGRTGRESLVTKVLAELRKPPAGAEVTTALRDDLRITGVRVEETTVYVDFSSDNLHGGSLEEILLVEQVVMTLTGLPGLEKVQFLVDGERRDTLMGHVSADEPLGPDDF